MLGRRLALRRNGAVGTLCPELPSGARRRAALASVFQPQHGDVHHSCGGACHPPGFTWGVDENISDAQILSAIEGMNNDSKERRHHRDPEDTFIQFELAKRTPEGDPTNGIVRVNGKLCPLRRTRHQQRRDPDAADQSAVKALTTWYGDDYVNIFIVPEIATTVVWRAGLRLPRSDRGRTMVLWCFTTTWYGGRIEAWP